MSWEIVKQPLIKYPAIKDFIKGAAIVPMTFVAMHVWNYSSGSDYLADDYSFANRFKVAYLATDPSERTYTIIPYDGNRLVMRDAYNDKYMITPWFTYPAMILCGAAYAAACHRRRKEEQKNNRNPWRQNIK